MWLQPNAKTFQDFLKVNMDYKSPYLFNIFMNIKGPVKSNHEELCENQRTLKKSNLFVFKIQLWFLYCFSLCLFSPASFLSFFRFFLFWVHMGMSMCMHVCTRVWLCTHECMESFGWLSIDPQASACLGSASIRITRVYHHTALHVNTGNRTQVFLLVRTFLTEQAQSSDPLFLLCWSSNSHPLWCLWFLKLKSFSAMTLSTTQSQLVLGRPCSKAQSHAVPTCPPPTTPDHLRSHVSWYDCNQTSHLL